MHVQVLFKLSSNINVKFIKTSKVSINSMYCLHLFVCCPVKFFRSLAIGEMSEANKKSNDQGRSTMQQCRNVAMHQCSTVAMYLYSRGRWISKFLKIKTGHLYSYVKLNFKASLFSCIFWFEAIFLGKRALLVLVQNLKTAQNKLNFKIGLKPTQM